MHFRNLLLAIGVIFVLAGLGLSLVWIRMNQPQQEAAPQDVSRPAMLVARHPLPTGTLLRPDDIGWELMKPGDTRPGVLRRGQVSDTEYLGALTRRDFAEGEALIATELVKPSDRRFLAAVLKPGRRAVSISVNAPQSSSGLVLPGDYVDVILTQHFRENIAPPTRRSVGETVLHNVRVVAVDRSLGTTAKSADEGKTPTPEARVPKTITLELNEQQVQTLFVSMQLGKLQLAVRPLEGAGMARVSMLRRQPPTWAVDVSPALKVLVRKHVRKKTRTTTGSSVERAVRRPPVLTH